MHRSSITLAGGVVFCLTVLALSAGAAAGLGLQPQAPNESALAIAEGRSPQQAPASRSIWVFFSRRPESYADFTALAPVPRMVSEQEVENAALESLIKGPTPEEQAAGYFSEVRGMLAGPSNCGGADFSIAVSNGTGTVRFCRVVSSAGVGQDARVHSQIEATLRQFSTVQRVRLLTADGHCLFDESGLDQCMQEPR
jgi:hypothetical protein